MTQLADYMPIMRQRMESGAYTPAYIERELTSPVDLCDERGQLAPEAVGWSRFPLVRANLSGHWPRKKRWNFWNWISPDFVLSAVIANIDYGAFCSVSFIDFSTGERLAHTSPSLPGRVPLPERVDETVSFVGGGIEYQNVNEGGDVSVRIVSPAGKDKTISADFVIRKPGDHESLNVVVPWSRHRFQLNSKHNTLPCEGEIRIGSERFVMDPATCHAVQDFGRGIWPHRSHWNWAVCTGQQGEDRIGVNMGAKWTTGTGSNENGILVNGRLYKVMEDLAWSYDPSNWMKPWRVRSTHSDAIDLTLRPHTLHRERVGFGPIGSGGVCCFGRWTGRIRVETRTIEVDEFVGWAEEFAHRW